ncbi:MAG: O-antigen ligase family protein [Bacteroidia bacterium]|nr:O-antigen ligase family protein [Bacteroidia bacterium]
MNSKFKITWLLVHIALGIIYAFFNQITVILSLIVFLLGLYFAIAKGNHLIPFMQCLIYLVGIEIATRSQNILPHEFAKYGISLLMIIYLLLNSKELNNNKTKWMAIMYFLLLIPSIITGHYELVEKPINVISFTLSGPMSLAVSCAFFSHYTLTITKFLKVISFAIYPIVLSLLYIIINAPNLNEIEWSLSANFESSANMTGPNQISSIFGMGLFFIFLFIYYKFYFIGYRWLDLLFFGLLLFRTIVLFSRGGLVSCILAIIIFFFIDFLSKKQTIYKKMNKIFQIIIFIILSIFLFNTVNDLSGGVLYRRYSGEKGSTKVTGKIDYFSNRQEIIDSEIILFLENPLYGIGPGLGKYYRLIESNFESGASSHTEFTRLLAEHGSFGLMAAIIIIYLSILSIKKNFKTGINIIIPLIILSLSTTFHAGMRLSMVGFIFGLSQITIVNYHKK